MKFPELYRTLILCGGLLIGVTAPVAEGAELTYPQLLSRYTDLSKPAVLPEYGEFCRQWSSYDRASQYDGENNLYIAWDANDDGPQYIRKEGDQEVFAEITGPGCIWRIWSALAEAGHVKIYLDGNPEPVTDMPFSHYFDGAHEPFAYPALSYNLEEDGSRGQNLYFPIPFQKSCKIVGDPGWGRYYQFTYSVFPETTQLPTFTKELASEHASDIQNIATILSAREGDKALNQRTDVTKKTFRLTPKPNQLTKITTIEGPAAIVGIRLHTAFKSREEEMETLRLLNIQIYWDDQEEPAVWCPIGDFFGSAPGINYYRTWPTGMTSDGSYALWYMPFAKSAEIYIGSDLDVQPYMEMEIIHEPLERPFEGLGYFHCKWHRDSFGIRPDRAPDWSLLNTKGRGRFMGVMLHVWNPNGGWWGEGDEKFFVDGEKFPSTFGTGSEDYFGYAWCHPGLFQRPFHAQTMTQNNAGHQSVLRWHIADNIPFHSSFEASIEKYYPNSRGTLYAATVCWYLDPKGLDPYAPAPVAQRRNYYVTPPLTAGGFKVIGRPNGEVQTQDMSGFSEGGAWADNDQLWWTNAGLESTMKLELPVETSGKYVVSATMTRAKDYAIVAFAVNGQPLGDPIDLYNPDVIRTEPIQLGTVSLEAGLHELEVKIVGANENALPSHMFGLDTLKLEPIE